MSLSDPLLGPELCQTQITIDLCTRKIRNSGDIHVCWINSWMHLWMWSWLNRPCHGFLSICYLHRLPLLKLRMSRIAFSFIFVSVYAQDSNTWPFLKLHALHPLVFRSWAWRSWDCKSELFTSVAHCICVVGVGGQQLHLNLGSWLHLFSLTCGSQCLKLNIGSRLSSFGFFS